MLGYFFYLFTDQLQNPWQVLVEPLGSAEPRLKITALQYDGSTVWPVISKRKMC